MTPLFSYSPSPLTGLIMPSALEPAETETEAPPATPGTSEPIEPKPLERTDDDDQSDDDGSTCPSNCPVG
jgi:hypothetical protein